MKKTCVIFVIALCFLLVAAVQMPYKTTVSAEPFSSFESGNKNYPEGLNDAISTHLFDTESSYPTFVNSVYIVREEYLIKKDKTTYFIPYIMADVRDVWTAGMSTWGFWLNTLVVEEDGTTTINANKNNNRSETIFTVEADPNTFIRDAYSGGFFEDCIMSITLGKIEWVAMKEPFFSFDAVTLDSSKPRNTDNVVSFKWESAFTYGIGKTVPFVVDGCLSYLGNYLSK